MHIIYVGVIQKSFCTPLYNLWRICCIKQLYRSILSMKTVRSCIFAVATMPMIAGA